MLNRFRIEVHAGQRSINSLNPLTSSSQNGYKLVVLATSVDLRGCISCIVAVLAHCCAQCYAAQRVVVSVLAKSQP